MNGKDNLEFKLTRDFPSGDKSFKFGADKEKITIKTSSNIGGSERSIALTYEEATEVIDFLQHAGKTRSGFLRNQLELDKPKI